MKASYSVFHSTLHGLYVCRFMIDGHLDYDQPGTDGTGIKLYDSFESANAAGKRYLRKMKKNGFTV